MTIARTWDGINLMNFKLVNKNNIFKEGTFENILVEQVIKFFEHDCYNRDTVKAPFYASEHYFYENILASRILKYLSQHKIDIPMDITFKSLLGQKACWYARLSGCIEAKKITDGVYHGYKPNVPVFGLYLESGIIDLLKDSDFINKLIKTSPTKDGLKHLIEVAKLSSAFRQLLRMPTIEFDPKNESSIYHKSKYKNLKVNNINIKNYQSFNFQTWPEIENIEVAATTRGIYHHLGDDVAFMLSAMEYGDFCILGSDEFGDIIPMYYYSYNLMNTVSFDDNRIFSWEDFDYIYGVPRINALYPSANNVIFKYASEDKDQCLINKKENSALAGAFWNNSVFNQLSGRNIATKSLKELSLELKQCVEKAIENSQFVKNNENLEKFFLEKYFHNKCLDLNNQDEVDFLNIANSFIRKNYSFFIKTVAQKVNCMVINPEEKTQLAFFKKSGESKAPAYLDLLYLLKFFMTQSKENKELGLTVEFYQKALINFLLGDNPKGFWEREYIHLYNYWLNLDKKSFVVSDLVEMNNEYRIFIVNGKIATGTPCYRNTTPFNAWTKGRLDPRLCDGHNATEIKLDNSTRNIAAKYGRFARKFLSLMNKEYPEIKSYVLDVCISYDKDNNMVVMPIEVNSINMSGAYQADMRKICAVVAGKKSNISSLNNVFNLDSLMSNPIDFIINKSIYYGAGDDSIKGVIEDVYEIQSDIIQEKINQIDQRNPDNLTDSDENYDDTETNEFLDFIDSVNKPTIIDLDVDTTNKNEKM